MGSVFFIGGGHAPWEHSATTEEGDTGTVDKDHLCEEGTGFLRVGSPFPDSCAAWELLEET